MPVYPLVLSNVVTFPEMLFLISLTRSETPIIISLNIIYQFVVFIKFCNYSFGYFFLCSPKWEHCTIFCCSPAPSTESGTIKYSDFLKEWMRKKGRKDRHLHICYALRILHTLSHLTIKTLSSILQIKKSEPKKIKWLPKSVIQTFFLPSFLFSSLPPFNSFIEV